MFGLHKWYQEEKANYDECETDGVKYLRAKLIKDCFQWREKSVFGLKEFIKNSIYRLSLNFWTPQIKQSLYANDEYCIDVEYAGHYVG